MTSASSSCFARTRPASRSRCSTSATRSGIAIDARLRAIADALAADADPQLAEDDAAALLAEKAALDEQRAALPRADALRAGPVARALALYAAEDEAGA